MERSKQDAKGSKDHQPAAILWGDVRTAVVNMQEERQLAAVQ
jgi:hypothetical protein